MKLIGSKIQSLRKNKNLTQMDLANVFSVSPQSVSKWENNISAPDISLLPMIARYFGITMDELFDYKLDALNYRERFIRFMADNGVLQFGKFTLKSGRISPYYINTSNYKTASQISKLGEFYAECYIDRNINTNLLISNTSKETPLMIATAMTLFSKYGIDIQYNSESIGKKPNITDKITLINDTLTSGSSLKNIFNKIQSSSGATVTDVIVSVDRMEVFEESSRYARNAIEQKLNVRIHSIVTLDDIISALEKQIIGGYEFIDPLKHYREEFGGIQW